MEPELNEADAVGAHTVLSLPCVATPSWRPVPTDRLDPLYGDARRLTIFRAARDTYWDMYSRGHVAPCTAFLAISLLQRCFLFDPTGSSGTGEEQDNKDDEDDDRDLAVAALWLAVKVMEGQDSALMGSGSVVCWTWYQFSMHHIAVHTLLRAECEALRRLQMDVMAPSTFDLFICCLRLSELRKEQKEDAYKKGLEFLIIVEGRPETLSYQEQEVVAGMCLVIAVPLPLELRDRISIDRLTLVTQFVDSFCCG